MGPKPLDQYTLEELIELQDKVFSDMKPGMSMVPSVIIDGVNQGFTIEQLADRIKVLKK